MVGENGNGKENGDGDFWTDVALVALRANLHECGPNWKLPPRVLPNHQVWIVVSGKARVAVAGTEHDLGSGSLLLLPPAVPHWGEHDPRSPLHCYVLHFEVRVLGAKAPGALTQLPPLLRPEPDVQRELVAAAAVMSREVGDRSPDHVLLANAAITRIVGLIWTTRAARRRRTPTAPMVSYQTTRLAPVFAHIVDHYARPITLTELASVAGVSPTHLSHVFRDAVGLSPFQYLQRYRLRRAKNFLDSTDLVVADIGRRVGFADPAYFSRAFRRLEGMSPRQYRESRSGGGESGATL